MPVYYSVREVEESLRAKDQSSLRSAVSTQYYIVDM